jgi:hypothetical protein
MHIYIYYAYYILIRFVNPLCHREPSFKGIAGLISNYNVPGRLEQVELRSCKCGIRITRSLSTNPPCVNIVVGKYELFGSPFFWTEGTAFIVPVFLNILLSFIFVCLVNFTNPSKDISSGSKI